MHLRSIGFGVLILCSVVCESAFAQRHGPFSDRTAVVTWRSGDVAREVRNRPTPLMQAIQARVTWVSELVPGLSIVTFPPGDAELLVEWMRLDPDAVDVLVDAWGSAASIPNDPKYPEQYQNYTSFRTCLESGWDVHRTSNVMVAVLDTGVWYSTSDMIPNHRVKSVEQLGVNCHDDDSNGISDDVHGAVFITDPNCCDPSPPCAPRSDPIIENDWHGNHVQSILGAAGNNLKGISGIVWNGSLLSVRVISDFGWLVSDLVKGMEYAHNEGARIMNMSLEGTYQPGQSAAVFEPIRQVMLNTPDTLYVVAAGNNGAIGIDLDATIGPGLDRYPAEFDCQNMLVVGASDGSDKRANFSNYGSVSVDVFAPGVHILGVAYPDDSFFHVSGTSQATPIAAGIAAILLDYNASLSAVQLRDSDRSLGTVVPALTGECVGAGGSSCTRVNLRSALGGVCP